MIRKERNDFNVIPCIVCEVDIEKDSNGMWLGIVSSI